MSRLPGFVVIGAMKCATTSLCTALARHPEVFFSDPKEPEFFCKEEVYANGLAWYHDLFSAAAASQELGEGTTSYTKRHLFPGTAQRLAEHLPNARLIYIVRHPLDRIQSHWLHSLRAGHDVPSDFSTAVRKVSNYIQTSKYQYQLEPYLERFSRDRILILFFEDWQQDEETALARCHEFLGLSANAPAEQQRTVEHASLGSLVEGKLLRGVRRSERLSAMLRRIPVGVRRPVRSLLSRRLDAKPFWDQPSLDHVREELTEDTEKFLAFCGKPADYWDLNEVAVEQATGRAEP